jgi:hypothetical protein
MFKYILTILLLILPITLLHARWDSLEVVPESVYAGGGIAYGGGYVWCIIGDDSDCFYAYDIAGDSWITWLEDMPDWITGAGAIAYESNWHRRIFVAAKIDGDFDQLFVYTRDSANTVDGEWNEEEISLPHFRECGPGVSLAYQPVARYYKPIQYSGGWLYLLLGGGEKRFYRRWFPVIFSPADTNIWPRGVSYDWEELPNIPDTVKAGGALCFNHYRRFGVESESLYAFVGGGKRNFYSYSPGQRIWTAKSQTPLVQNNGSSITPCDRYDRYLYAIFGKDNPLEWWYYEVDENEWNRKDNDIPDSLKPGASITGQPDPRRFWLVIGEGRNNFYTHDADDEEGPESQRTTEISLKSRILSYPDRISVQFSIDVNSIVRIHVYDLSGKLVKVLLCGKVKSGEHQISWNKDDKSGKRISSGIYFITINKGDESERFKTVIVE